MTTKEKTNSPQRIARVVGVLSLVIFGMGISAELLVRGDMIVPGDAATTFSNMMASESLFRLSLVSDLVRQTLLMLLPLALYKLLKPVNKNIAALMVTFGLITVSIGMLNMLNHIAALLLSSGADYLTAFEADQLHALVMFFLDLYKYGGFISQFLVLWLLFYGYLVFKSGFLPKILGIFLMIASLGHPIYAVSSFLFPNANVMIFGLIAVLGEFLLALWLLIKGVNVEEWEKRALLSA